MLASNLEKLLKFYIRKPVVFRSGPDMLPEDNVHHNTPFGAILQRMLKDGTNGYLGMCHAAGNIRASDEVPNVASARVAQVTLHKVQEIL